MECVFDYGAVLLLAENDTDRRMLILLLDLPVEHRQVELHLTCKLGLKLPNLQFDCNETAEPSMKEQEVDKEFFPIQLQPVLTAHKSKHTTHGPQEVLYPSDNGFLQFPLAVFVTEIQKVEGVFVLHRQLCLITQLRSQCLVKIGLSQEILFVALILDLVNEHVFWTNRTFGSCGCRIPVLVGLCIVP